MDFLGFEFLGHIKLSFKVCIIGVLFTQLGERCDSRVELFDEILAFATEKESLGVIGCEVNDLLCDSDHRLILLELEFADTQVGETNQF